MGGLGTPLGGPFVVSGTPSTFVHGVAHTEHLVPSPPCVVGTLFGPLVYNTCRQVEERVEERLKDIQIDLLPDPPVVSHARQTLKTPTLQAGVNPLPCHPLAVPATTPGAPVSCHHPLAVLLTARTSCYSPHPQSQPQWLSKNAGMTSVTTYRPEGQGARSVQCGCEAACQDGVVGQVTVGL